ncbi:MAG: ribonuclease P [Methanobacteriales archaeon Met13]
MRRGRRPKWMIKIAYERLEILFKMAEEEFSLHPERSNRYAEMARNIAQKYNLKTPPYWRGRFCKQCNRFLKPGFNSKIRLNESAVTTKCLECGEIRRNLYKSEQKTRRRNKIESHTFQEGIDE